MSNLKFVIQSNFGGPNGSDGYEDGHRPKRAKHACLACQSRKVKCSGVSPCDLCKAKKIECEFKDSSNKVGSNHRDSVSTASNGKANSHQKEIITSAPTPATTSTARSNNINMKRPKPHLPSSTTASNINTNNNKRCKLQTTRQPYFRWLGPTAIAPPHDGTYRLLSVNLRSNEPSNDRKTICIERQPVSLERASIYDSINHNNYHYSNNNTQQPPGGGSNSSYHSSSKSSPESTTSEFDHFPPLPPKEVFRNFSENMTNYLPYMSIEGFEDSVSQGIIGECLLYAMASISERLNPKSTTASNNNNGGSSSGDLTPMTGNMAEKYLEAAKRLVIPHLASPSVEIIHALLLIAYSEFAEDRDSGLWSWSGMAIRMCYDLGLHKAPPPDDAEAKVARKVFWSVVCLDRLISCGTGRAVSIPDRDIEHECEPGKIIGPDGQQQSRSDPFPYLCKLLLLLGQVSDYLNTHATNNNSLSNLNRRKSASSPNTENKSSVSPSSLSPESWDQMETFAKFQQQVSDFYTSLPPDLLFDVQNFQEFSKMKLSQVFLLLHIWNQALVLAVHHPTTVYPKAQIDIMGFMSNPYADLTGTGSISIADMISFADLIDSNSFLANPFLSQPIYMAACASLTLSLSLPQSSPSHKVHTLQRTFSTCKQVLTRMQRIWRGISWHSRTLESLAASEPDVDLSVNSKGFVTTKDLGVVRKATVDEATRKWLADEIGDPNNDEIYGLFVSGITENQQPLHQPLSNQQILSSKNLSPQNTDNSNIVQVSSDVSPTEPRQQSQQQEPYTTANSDETFRHLMMRNMDIDEYLKPF